MAINMGICFFRGHDQPIFRAGVLLTTYRLVCIQVEISRMHVGANYGHAEL